MGERNKGTDVRVRLRSQPAPDTLDYLGNLSTKGVILGVTGSWHWTLVQGTQRQEGPKR